MPQIYRHIFVCFLLLIFIPFSLNSKPKKSELDVLLKLKQQWGSVPSIQAWDPLIPPCNWPGIQCTGTLITGILLQDQNITDRIPAVICDLTYLTTLNLSDNFIPGGFPTVLYNCSKLQKLDLSQNYFVGPLPSDIHMLSSLKYLDISGNNFTSEIPNAIGQLTNLTTLNLVYNLLTGTVPPAIGNLVNLEVLEMANNGFDPSKIPETFAQLKKLKYLWMAECNLIGEIPENFFNLSSLEHLDMGWNSLVGRIPTGLFQLRNLTHLYLYSNQLSGEIPTSVQALNLVEIDLSMNNLEGAVSEDFGKLQKLELLHLYTNQLSGSIPASIGKLPVLKRFDMHINNLSGVLPPELGLHSKLESLDVSENQFSGELPKYLCAQGALAVINTFRNNFSGEIPESLAKCDTLIELWLSFNKHSGMVPFDLWTLPNILHLILSDNEFSGRLPMQLSAKLIWLDIGNNKFSGPIPSGVSNWRNLLIFRVINNQFSGTIPSELTSLSSLIALLLDGNQFSGELPSQIISWESLATLSVSRNNLSGRIPAALGSLPRLTCLVLSNNELSGQIPPELGHLKLSTLDLSSNNLSGKIPFPLDNVAYQNSFFNNSNLCSVTQTSDLPRCSSLHHTDRSFCSRYLLVILLPGIAVLLVTFYVIFSKVTVKHSIKQPAWVLIPFHRLNFTEANVLCSLIEDNVIGSGGSGKIYSIHINDSDDKVAVKRIWNDRKSTEALEKQFVAEVEILGRIRHANIVKLLCCISSENSKLLVYEYMESQSLDKWVHRERSALDWSTRLRIATGAAKGLCYMHHDCCPPIIHRDVKSSNILLDSEFNAKIADFGFAKMLANATGEPLTVSAVAGSFGYIAPEYWHTRRLNEKIDVYSFGVVLLELATGKEACKGNDHLNLADWSWEHYFEGRPMEDALDNVIMEHCFLQEMTSVFKLGLMCTNKVPSSRPSMKQVLQVLTLCSHHQASDRRMQDQDGDGHSIIPLYGGDNIAA